MEFEAIKNHRYGRLIRLMMNNHGLKSYLADLGSCFLSLFGLITFFVLSINALSLTLYFMSVVFQSSSISVIFGIFLIMYIITVVFIVFKLIHHFSDFGYQVFMNQVHYWCRNLIGKNWNLFLLDPYRLNEFIYFSKKTNILSKYFDIRSNNRVLNQKINFLELFYSISTLTIIITNLTSIALKMEKNKYLSSLKYNKLSIFIFIIGMLNPFYNFSMFGCSVQISLFKVALLINIIGFFLSILGYYLIVNYIVTLQSRNLAIKSIIYVTFLRDPNSDFSPLNYQAIHKNLNYKEILSVINSYLYPEQKTEDETLTTDGDSGK